MASNIPAALKSADVGRFAVRAAQLEKAKPIIAYWCNFYIVNQIIEKGLHTADEEVKLYTTELMEKLEHVR
jgi:vacuolar protein sorting-associated protein VTA1